MIKLGQNVKVHLPGEAPWAEIVEIRIKGRIVNKLFHEHSEHEQAQFMKREFGDVQPLEQSHKFKQGDEVWFEKDEHGQWEAVTEFSQEFISEIITLLDRIEIEGDPLLASQRFAIGEKHGLTVVIDGPASGATH